MKYMYNANEMRTMNVSRLANSVSATLTDNGRFTANVAGMTAIQKNVIAERKEEIRVYLTEMKATAEDRKRRIDAIEGLKEIRDARYKIERYNAEFRKEMESPEGLIVAPVRPNVDLNSLNAMYPRAAAYLKAESYSCAANYEKAACGREALEKIIYDENNTFAQIIEEMESKWNDCCMKRMWD